MALLNWKFDDKVQGSLEEWSWVEIINLDPPGLHIPHMIIVRSYEIDDIEKMLRYLESEGDLLSASKLIE